MTRCPKSDIGYLDTKVRLIHRIAKEITSGNVVARLALILILLAIREKIAIGITPPTAYLHTMEANRLISRTMSTYQ